MKKAKVRTGLLINSLLKEEGNLFTGQQTTPVVLHREKSGKVSQSWLSACAAERALTKDLLSAAMQGVNLLRAYRRVVSNAGSAGVDGMTVKDLKEWMRKNLNNIGDEILAGRYTPQGVKTVEIPKPNGGKRQLGIPTVIDRMLQQAIHQVMSPGYERVFSDHSYGFRPKRSAHHALAQASNLVSEGKCYVVDLDLEKFFDEVNHDRLMWLLSTRIGDKRMLLLIRKYLQAGTMHGGLLNQHIKGTPQGSPLSPLLSNIVLDELDKEMDRRGLSYVRYADDIKIFCSSQKAAQKVKQKITQYITDVLKLKVNEQKSAVRQSYELNFLGHGIDKHGNLLLSKQSEDRLMRRARSLTKRNKGISFEQMLQQLHLYLGGWLTYFRYARMQKKLQRIDSWLRRRLRCVRLKQCKRAIGIVRWLRKLGMTTKRSWLIALSGKGWWRLCNTPAVNEAMNNNWLSSVGFYCLSDHYAGYQVNKTAVCV
ncbi:group II intron reverse transcriptase/maturase [soil metagenome]